MNRIGPTLRAAARLVGLLGMIVAPAGADILHLDDVIIDRSLCVGFDCVNGEAFGFDTIRLKEHKLRIHFMDTSSSAAYPDNDWRIVVNDSGNGGAEYFGIEDSSAGRSVFRIYAGARADALVVDSGGDVGVGTATPTGDVHLKTGNTPTLRLEQDTTAGFDPQSWDVAGNESNFFVRDLTYGSQMPFKIRPNTPTNSLFLENGTGDAGFGTSSPEQPIHVRRTDASSTNILIENANAAGQNTQLQLANGTGNRWDLRNNTAGDFAITLGGSGINEMLIDDATGNMTIAGGLVTGTAGSCTAATPCDAVFRPGEYTVESIDEHAAYMWQNEHLRGVGPTPAGQPINLTLKTTGILHELEKAHIYIERLHRRLQQSAAERAELRMELAEIKAVIAALAD